MINAIVAFKKAVAEIGFKKAVASIKLGDFLIFKFFFETLGLSDVQVKSISKSLSDSQAVTDLSAQSVGKTLSDSSGTADSAALDIGSAVSDTIGSNDTGSIRSQGYCAFDYFLEDYVGASRTF